MPHCPVKLNASPFVFGAPVTETVSVAPTVTGFRFTLYPAPLMLENWARVKASTYCVAPSFCPFKMNTCPAFISGEFWNRPNPVFPAPRQPGSVAVGLKISAPLFRLNMTGTMIVGTFVVAPFWGHPPTMVWFSITHPLTLAKLTGALPIGAASATASRTDSSESTFTS